MTTDTRYPDSSASCKALADRLTGISCEMDDCHDGDVLADSAAIKEAARILRDVVPLYEAVVTAVTNLGYCRLCEYDSASKYDNRHGHDDDCPIAALDALEKDDE